MKAIHMQIPMRFGFLVCCCLLIGVGSCVGESVSPAAAATPIQPRVLANDPHATRRNRIKDKPNSPEEIIPAYDRFLSRNTRLNEDLEHLFTTWDSNRDGVLSQHEINLLCEQTVVSPTEYDMLMSFDVDGSGAVDHTEFKLGPLFVNALEHDKARNEAFNKAAAHDEAAQSHPSDAATATPRLAEQKIEPLGEHVLTARQYFRERLALDTHPLTSSSLPLSSQLTQTHLASSLASDLAPSATQSHTVLLDTPAPTTTTPLFSDETESEQETDPSSVATSPSHVAAAVHTPAVLLSLSEKITHSSQAHRVDLHDLDDKLRMPDLLTTPDHSGLASLLQRVDTSVKKTLKTHGGADGDLSTVSFEKPTLDNLDDWVGKAKDIMFKLKQKKLGQAIEEAIPQTKLIEEQWRITNAKAAEEHKRQQHEHHHQHTPSGASARVRAYRARMGAANMGQPTPTTPGFMPVEYEFLEGESRAQARSTHGTDMSRLGRWNRKKGRGGDMGRVIGKEFYSPSSHEPARSAAELTQRRLAAEQQTMLTQQMMQAQPQPQLGGMNFDGQPSADSSFVQRDQQQIQTTDGQQAEAGTEAQARTGEEVVQEGEALLAREGFHGPTEADLPRLQQQRQINLGGALKASIGGSVKVGGSASIGGSIGAAIGGSASLSVGAKASASVGAKVTAGAKTTTPAAPVTKPQVKITLKPAAPTGDGLPESKFGIPSYDDERCVLCQYLVQRTEANLFKRMLLVLDMDRRHGVEAGVGRNAVTLPQPYTESYPSSTGDGTEPPPTFTSTTAPGGGATGTTGYIWDVLSRAYSGAGSNLEYGLWMDPTDPNNVDGTSQPLSDYVMKDIIRHVADYTDGRGHGIVRYTAEDTLSDFCAEDNVPALFYAYCPDFWSALPTIVDALYFGYHGDATCEEAQMCGTSTYFNTQNAVHLPNKSRYYNAGRGVCGLVGGSRERKRGGKLLSATCTASKVLGKF